MAKALYFYEIQEQQSFPAYQTHLIAPGAIILPEVGRGTIYKIISATSEQEANEVARENNPQATRLIEKLSIETIFELLDISPEDISPLNISSAIEYTKSEYRNELSKEELKALDSVSKKVKGHLIKLLA